MTSTDDHARVNPAAELLEIFTAWRDDDGRASVQRRGLVNRDWGALSLHMRAMFLIEKLDRTLVQLDAEGRRVATYRRRLADWTAAVLALNSGSWGVESNSRQDFDDAMMESLEHLADLLDNLPGVAPAAARAIEERLEDVLAAVDETEIDELLAAHIRSAVGHLRVCLDDYAAHGYDFAIAAWNAIWVGATAAAAQTTGSQRARWQTIRDQFLVPAGASFLGSAPQLILQLTQGAS